MVIFLLAVLVIVLLLIATGYILFFVAIVRYDSKSYPNPSPRLKDYAAQISEGSDWFKSQPCEQVRISAYDGTPLSALYLPAEDPKGTIILCHGYRMDGYTDFACVYKLYHELGYSLLNIFQRGHGESGGKYICFGIKERFDCRSWAWYITDRFGLEHNIFLGGLSMGTSTVLMATATGLPENVRGVIADCGFTSPYDEFEYILKKRLHLPVHPIIDITDMFSRLFAGFGFKDFSTVTAMETNKIPVLFIHGESDNFVPMKSTILNYGVCKAPKKLITVPDAGHGFSYLIDTERCQTALLKFLDKNTVIIKKDKKY